MEFFFLVLAGLVGGFIAGLVGIGTGIIMLAVIPLVLPGYMVAPEHIVSYTVANTIFATMCSSFVNIATIIRQKNMYWKDSLAVSIAAVVCAILVFETFVKSDYYSKTLFNTLVVLLLATIIYRSIKKLRINRNKSERKSTTKLTLAGSAAGTLAALTGLGGGAILMPLLNIWLRVDIIKARNISFVAIFAIATVLSLINLFGKAPDPTISAQGLIIYDLILPLSIGVVIGSPLGVLSTEKVSPRKITVLFLLLTSLVLLRKLMELAA
jgi:uncharacterized protein